MTQVPENLNQYMGHSHAGHPQSLYTIVPWVLALVHQNMKIPPRQHHTIHLQDPK